jgi:hypothetical protein
MKSAYHIEFDSGKVVTENENASEAEWAPLAFSEDEESCFD